MQVIDLLGGDFAGACQSLAAEIVAAGYRPDVVVGIASGGWVIAQEMMQGGAFSGAQYCQVRCRRPSSTFKDRAFVKAIIRRLPRWLSDSLRAAEARVIGRKSASAPRLVEASEDVLRVLAGSGQILVVDDAVDSGSTLRAVVERVRSVAKPESLIVTAAVTLTNPEAAIAPDIVLHRGVLIRFPWAPDASAGSP